jgi:hypothetical protein
VPLNRYRFAVDVSVLTSISCSGDSSCAAVGLGFIAAPDDEDLGSLVPVAARWNRSAWTTQSVPSPPYPADMGGDAELIGRLSDHHVVRGRRILRRLLADRGLQLGVGTGGRTL